MCVPLSIILKSAAVLREDELAGVAAVAWEYLLQSDKELVSTAGTCVLALLWLHIAMTNVSYSSS